MNSATVSTKSVTWTTNINGTKKSVEKYFLGKWFNIGVYPAEQMEKIIKVEFHKEDVGN